MKRWQEPHSTAPTVRGRADRRRSLLVVASVYAAALGASVVAGALVGDVHPIWTVAIADLTGTVVVFTASAALDNSSIYDPYWSVAPVVIAGYFMATLGVGAARGVVVLLLVAVWGARLTGNWIRGWPGLPHEDWRYGRIRGRTGRLYWPASFFGIHLLPTVVVFLACLPLYAVLSADHLPVGIGDALALFVTAGAIWIEARADRQLHEFKMRSHGGTGADNVLDSGLWKYSRHPNYFGEISFWWGLWLFGVAADPGFWWTIVGPLVMTALFTFISVPMIDWRLRAKKPGYINYMRRTPAVIPWFGKRGAPTGEGDQ